MGTHMLVQPPEERSPQCYITEHKTLVEHVCRLQGCAPALTKRPPALTKRPPTRAPAAAPACAARTHGKMAGNGE